MALPVYDMQIGIVGQTLNAEPVTAHVISVITTARKGGFRVLVSRHLFPPNEAAGTSQLRRAMAWLRKGKDDDVNLSFPRDSPRARIIPEITPLESEVVFEKLGQSFVLGTPLEMALRDSCDPPVRGGQCPS